MAMEGRLLWLAVPQRVVFKSEPFGELLRRLRGDASHGEYARRLRVYAGPLKVNPSNLVAWEDGRVPNWQILHAYARVSGMSFIELATELARVVSTEDGASLNTDVDTDALVTQESLQERALQDVTDEPDQTLISGHAAPRASDQAAHEDAIAKYARKVLREVVALRKARLAAEERPRRA